jgi:hypothetical protein
MCRSKKLVALVIPGTGALCTSCVDDSKQMLSSRPLPIQVRTDRRTIPEKRVFMVGQRVRVRDQRGALNMDSWREEWTLPLGGGGDSKRCPFR